MNQDFRAYSSDTDEVSHIPFLPPSYQLQTDALYNHDGIYEIPPVPFQSLPDPALSLFRSFFLQVPVSEVHPVS